MRLIVSLIREKRGFYAPHASLIYPGGVYTRLCLPGTPWWYIPGYASLVHPGGIHLYIPSLYTLVGYLSRTCLPVYLPVYPCSMPETVGNDSYSRVVEGERPLRLGRRLSSPQNKPFSGQETG